MILRFAVPFIPWGTPLLVAYCAVGAVACASVSLARGPVLPALREAAQEGLLAPVGLLILGFRKPQSGAALIRPSPVLVVGGRITVGVFWVISEGTSTVDRVTRDGRFRHRLLFTAP